ncbi:MAG: ribosome-recycling factor [Pyrinomonadaceae bacterium]
MTIRTGRAAVNLLDSSDESITTERRLRSIKLASVHVAEPQLLTVRPWDLTQAGAIEKAIRASDLGLNPGQRRQAGASADSAAHRGAAAAYWPSRLSDVRRGTPHGGAQRAPRRQRAALKKLLKDKTISEDAERDGLEEIQKLTNNFIAKIDELAKTKEQELLKRLSCSTEVLKSKGPERSGLFHCYVVRPIQASLETESQL